MSFQQKLVVYCFVTFLFLITSTHGEVIREWNLTVPHRIPNDGDITTYKGDKFWIVGAFSLGENFLYEYNRSFNLTNWCSVYATYGHYPYSDGVASVDNIDALYVAHSGDWENLGLLNYTRCYKNEGANEGQWTIPYYITSLEAYGKDYLWVTRWGYKNGGWDREVYKLDLNNKNVVKRFWINLTDYASEPYRHFAITVASNSDKFIWLAYGNWIYKVDTEKEEIIKSYNTKKLFGFGSIRGITTVDGKHFWTYSYHGKAPHHRVRYIPLENSPPIVQEVLITQTPQQNLLCKTNVSDPDNDSVSISYRWFINGKKTSITTKILPREEFTKTDEIICQVKPFDGKIYGESKNSSIFTLQPKPLEKKALIISNSSWKNILSVSTLNRPVIISDKIDEKIEYFVTRYNPEKIYLIGDLNFQPINQNIEKIKDLDAIPSKLYKNKQGILVNSLEKGILTSGLASLLKRPIVFNNENPYLDLREKTKKEIQALYLKEIKNRRKNINYLVLSPQNYPLTSVITARKQGFPVLVSPNKIPEKIKERMTKSTKKLNKNNLFIDSPDYILNGAYLLITGKIPSITKQDPVEKLWLFKDPLDGDSFKTDLEYGDLNNDTYLDVSVGRLPENQTLASIVFARAYLSDERKKALVASEYLYGSWPVILAYIGGGMWQGKTIANILREQDYSISRLVERRIDPIDFLVSLTPANLKGFLHQSKMVGSKLGSLVGKSIGSVITKALIVIKVLNYIEQVLELYLEFNWSTFGPKYSNAQALADSITAETTPQEIAVGLFYLVWPNPYPTLNETNLQENMKNSDLIYYEGIGNGTLWILPNPMGERGTLGWREFFMNRYSGKHNLTYKEIPSLKSKLVWDNSNLAARKDKEMWKKFLKQGSSSIIGASGVNYAPYSSEIDTRFFKAGESIGESLKNSVNDFRDDWITYDPFNMVFRRGKVKTKVLREFRLYGDPSLKKDPIIEKDNSTKVNVKCNEFCWLDVEIKVPYKLIERNGTRTISMNTSNYLLNAFEPILPLKKFSYYLPYQAEVINYSIFRSNTTYRNITFPVLNPLSHGGRYINKTSVNRSFSEKLYPSKLYRFNTTKTIDNRTKLQLVHALVQYNEKTKEATVFNKIHLRVKYKSPLEMSILPSKFYRGEKIEVKVKLKNNQARRIKGSLYVKILNQTTSRIKRKNFSLKPKEEKVLKIDPKGRKILVKVLAFSESIKLGPREKVFRIYEREERIPNVLEISPKRILKIYESLRETVRKVFSSSKLKIERKKSNVKIIKKIENGAQIKKVITPDFRLVSTDSPKTKELKLTSKYGSLVIKEIMGNKTEIIKGNTSKLKQQLKRGKELLKRF